MDLKFALCCGSFSNDIKADRLSIQDVMDIALKLGFKAVEIREDLFKNRDEDLQDIKQKAATTGLDLIYSYMNKVLYELSESTRDNCDKIKSRINEAVFLGSPIIKVSFGEFNNYADIPAEHFKYVSELVNYAEQNKVVISVENSDGAVGGNPTAIKQFTDKINSPYFKVTYDCGNYAKLGFDPVEALNLLAEHTKYIHLKDFKKGDTKSTFIGNGDIDFGSIMSVSKKSGYDGYLCFEFGMSIDKLDEIEKSIIYINRYNGLKTI